MRLLGLSARAFHFLTNAGITTIEELDQLSDRELLKVQNFGQRGLEETRAAVVRWRGQDHVERLAHYLRRNLPREDRERLAALLTGQGDEADEMTKDGGVPAVGNAIAYLDRQIGGAIDPRAMAWMVDQVRPALLRIREAVEAAETSLDEVFRGERRDD